MTRAGESVGKAVGTGLRAVRRGAVRAGHAGAEVTAQVAAKAEHKLAEHGVAPEQLRDTLVDKADEVGKTTRRARKELAKQGTRLAKKGDRKRAELLAKAEDIRDEVLHAADRARAESTDRAGDLRAKAIGRAKDLRAEAKDRARDIRSEAKGRAKDVRKAAKQAGKDYRAEQPKGRRRWPWVLGLVATAAAAGYVVLSRRPQEVHLHDDEQQPTQPTSHNHDSAHRGATAQETQHASNGRAAH
ncbi:hypothetical protein F0L68_09695 [Solihabitans fulvus]|uniref:Uncharacterized protein n=2 Tax=Solihabitans fulvus TaxID=1892852 RepID=A0A5B2XKV8_9PSEU|nr:hypothetical protein F0L68_09695 [Solihabitans fulvus]